MCWAQCKPRVGMAPGSQSDGALIRGTTPHEKMCVSRQENLKKCGTHARVLLLDAGGVERLALLAVLLGGDEFRIEQIAVVDDNARFVGESSAMAKRAFRIDACHDIRCPSSSVAASGRGVTWPFCLSLFRYWSRSWRPNLLFVTLLPAHCTSAEHRTRPPTPGLSSLHRLVARASC